MSDAEFVEAQAQQRAESRRATFEALKAKRRGEREISVRLEEDGEPVTFLFRALGITEYDRLITDNPPTKDQLAQGEQFNVNTFGPQLLSKVCADPQLSTEQWRELWTSGEWSGGELSGLFGAAMELCGKGLTLAPTSAG